MTDIRKPLNVFAQSVNVGQIAEISAAGPESQTVMVNSGSQSTTIIPGKPMKLVTGASQVPLVDIAIPGTDPIYGLALYNPKVSKWLAGDILQVTTAKSVVFLQSSGSLARGAQVGMNSSSFKIQASTLANHIGTLLDDATTDAIVRVELDIPLGVTRASA